MKTIIIGSGVQGLACAFALGKRGVGPITIMEAKRVGYGASSRCGGGIRAQFRNAENILLAKWSIELFEKLTSELQYQILFHHGGYMYLHHSEADAQQAEQDVALQNQLGVPTKLITPQKAAKMVPGINMQGVRVVKYNDHDASCHHDALLWAYLRALSRMRISLRLGIRVSKIEVQGKRVIGVIVDNVLFPAEEVIIAAGAWSRDLLSTVGVDIPVQPWKRETLVTMPVRHFLDPFVIDNQRNIYLHQTLRGEILGGASIPLENPSMDWDASRLLLETWCRGICQLFPSIGQLSVIRQWAGTRCFTPDGSPIFGPVSDINGLWMICGQSGAGFMLAPAIAEALAGAIAGETAKIDWSIYSPERFGNNKELWERTPQI